MHRLRILLPALLLGYGPAAHAQTAPPPPAPADTLRRPEAKVYDIVDEKPIFSTKYPGIEGVMHYLASTIRYPAEALRANVTGKVFVQFVVSEVGDVSDVRVVRGAHPTLDAEALRVVRGMPRWAVPAQHGGRAVKYAYTMPVTFNVGWQQSNLEDQYRQQLKQAAQANAAALQAKGDAVARFPGGPAALLRYLRPPAPAGTAPQTVFVAFRVDEQGAVQNVLSLSLSPTAAPTQLVGAAEAAVDLVRRMPRWEPARRRGKAVATTLVLPVMLGAEPLAADTAPPLPYADVPPALAPRGGATLEWQQLLMKHYSLRRHEPVAGQAVVFFMVNELAQIEQPQILKSLNPAHDTALLEAVAQLRPSAPALQDGQPARVYYVFVFDSILK